MVWHLGSHLTSGEHLPLVYGCQLYSVFFSVLHVAAHLVNALNFSENYNEDFLSLNAANYRGEVSQLSFLYFAF